MKSHGQLNKLNKHTKNNLGNPKLIHNKNSPNSRLRKEQIKHTCEKFTANILNGEILQPVSL